MRSFGEPISREEFSRLEQTALAAYDAQMNADDLRKLYPGLTDEELNIARENLDLYLEFAWEIIEELSTLDGKADAS